MSSADNKTNNCLPVPGFCVTKNNTGKCVKGECNVINLKNNNKTRYIKKLNKKYNTNTTIQSNPTGIKNFTITSKSNIYSKSNSYIYTGKCNFIKFFEFLHFYGKLNKNIYVVSHSHAMQDFIKESNTDRPINTIIKKTKKDYDKIFKQNLWSMIFKSGNNEYKITRHAFSVANLIKERASLSILTWFKRKSDQTSEKDAALSIYGILTALQKNEKNEKINTVYVSPLIRTWMTATCLYLYSNSNEKTFEIVISPYIIEKGKTDDNIPNEFCVQIKMFHKFLNLLVKIGITKPEYKIINRKTIINIYDGRSNKMCTYTSGKINSNVKVINQSSKECVNKGDVCLKTNDLIWTKQLKDEGVLYFKNKVNNSKISITFVELLKGVNKPDKDILGKLSRWCEPLSMERPYENNKRKSSMCIKRLNSS